MVGETFGRFRILSLLGQGGMGTVWRAEDQLLGRIVALKLLPDTLAQSGGARRRFLQEARATSRLSHPGIATLYDAGDQDGRLWLAVMLVEGETLASRIRERPVAGTQAIRIAAEIADALEHAHARGIVHRDVTPKNIMLDRDERAILIDFGVARHLETTGATSSNTIVGTILYLAPEVLKGGTADARSDLYGLGAVLYETLTGRPPFEGARPEALIHAIVHARPERPSHHCVAMDPRLEQLVLRLLAKEPGDRPASAAHLAAELRALLESAPADEAVTATGRTERKPRIAPARRLQPARRVAIAILPFQSLGEAGADSSAFASGLAESLRSALARAPELRVLSSLTPARNGVEAEAIEEARALGAHMAISGSVQRMGDRLRVSFSVLDLKHREQKGGERVDGTIADPFALEDDLLGAVTRALEIGSGTHVRGGSRLSAPVAHEMYLRALGHMQRTDNEASVDGAIGLLEQVVQSEGGTAVVQATLGRAYLRKSELSLDPQWHQRAEQACRRALELDPHSPDVMVTLGRLQLQTGRHAEAIATLRSALEVRRENADAWHALSRAYEGAGQFEEAKEAARETIHLRPIHCLSWDRLALLCYRTGAYGEAVDGWRRASELTPDNARVLAALGGALIRLERIDEAREAYGRSVSVMPLGIAYIGLGVADFLAGDLRGSVSALERAVAMTPMDPRTWGNLADAQRWVPGLEVESRRSFQRALALVRAQLRVNPNDARFLSYLALWLGKVERTREALDAIEKARAIAPDDLDILLRAVSVHHMAGDAERAADLLESALARGCSLLELEKDPELDGLRQMPRVASLLIEERARRCSRKSA